MRRGDSAARASPTSWAAAPWSRSRGSPGTVSATAIPMAPAGSAPARSRSTPTASCAGATCPPTRATCHRWPRRLPPSRRRPAPSSRSGRRLGPLLLPLGLAQLHAPDLAGQRLGEIVDELDLARVRVRGVALAHEPLYVLGGLVGRLVPLGEHDERLDDVPALRIR